MDWRDALAGGLSGMVTRCVVAPLDVIKIRLQLQVVAKGSSRKGVKYTGIWRTLCVIVQEEGVLALWKGNLTAEFLWGGYMATQFVTYRGFQVCGL